jgi:hypothetical protein
MGFPIPLRVGRQAMGLFDGLEKLITEHGSAAILKERIALAKDQYAAVEKRVGELQAENSRLREQNKKLEAQVASSALADPCPRCRKRAYELLDSKADPVFGDLGASRRTYKCSSCAFSESKIASNQ